jgi:hypothetical protein
LGSGKDVWGSVARRVAELVIQLGKEGGNLSRSPTRLAGSGSRIRFSQGTSRHARAVSAWETTRLQKR